MCGIRKRDITLSRGYDIIGALFAILRIRKDSETLELAKQLYRPGAGGGDDILAAANAYRNNIFTTERMFVMQNFQRQTRPK